MRGEAREMKIQRETSESRESGGKQEGESVQAKGKRCETKRGTQADGERLTSSCHPQARGRRRGR